MVLLGHPVWTGESVMRAFHRLLNHSAYLYFFDTGNPDYAQRSVSGKWQLNPVRTSRLAKVTIDRMAPGP